MVWLGFVEATKSLLPPNLVDPVVMSALAKTMPHWNLSVAKRRSRRGRRDNRKATFYHVGLNCKSETASFRIEDRLGHARPTI